KGPLESRNLFFYISLNALAFGGRKLRWVRRNCLRRGCDRPWRRRRVWRSGWSRSWLRRRRRRGRADKPVCETGRGRPFAPSAQKSERLVESIDKIDDPITCAFCIGRDLLCKICALDGDGRYAPGDQPPKRDKDDSEKKSYSFRATETASGHLRYEGVGQI